MLRKLLTTTALILSLHTSGRASSLLVSYTTASGGGGIERYSLTPQSAGTTFDTETTPVTSLTAVNNTAYWATGTRIFSDSLTDPAAGAGKTLLSTIPFAGFSISDLAVDPITNTYLVGWIAPGLGWFVVQYPLAPNSDFTIFSNDTAPIQGLTVVGNTAYWTEGSGIFSEHLDGTGKSQIQSFNFGAVTLNDLAVDPASQTYFLAAATSGLPPLIARYPLTLNSSGTLFAFANSNINALTIAGDQAYWIDGMSIWSENLNGTGLTLQETLPSQLTPTDLAVSLDPMVAAPEPATWTLLGIALLLCGTGHRRSVACPLSIKNQN